MSQDHQARFLAMREAIVADLRDAHMHYHQFRSIRQAVPRYVRVMNRAKQFWSLVLNAHLDATRMSLAKFYDQTRKTASLPNLLCLIENDPSLLESDASRIVDAFHSTPLKASELADDQSRVNPKDNLVHRLTVQRGNVFAHSSSKSHEQLLTQFPLTNKCFSELLERGERILNRYSVLHDGTHYAMHDTVTQDDYKHVLEACAAHLQEQRAPRSSRLTTGPGPARARRADFDSPPENRANWRAYQDAWNEPTTHHATLLFHGPPGTLSERVTVDG